MIPKTTINRFIHAPRRDHRWVKDLSGDELNRTLSKLDPAPRLSPGLHTHQKACFLLGTAYPQFAFWLDMGLGKTLLSLELLRYWWETGKLKRALIMTTSDKAYPTWTSQLRKFKIDLPYVCLTGSSNEKLSQAASLEEGLIFCHYPGLVAMLTHKVRRQRLPDKTVTDLFSRDINAIILDESTKVGNQDSLTYILLNYIAEVADIRYELAGRPFGRDPGLVWSQYKLLDGGGTLGETQGLFEAAFYRKKKAWEPKPKFDKRKMPHLTRILQNYSITYGVDECPDLPPLGVTPIIERVRLPEETSAYYDRLVAQIIAARGDAVTVENTFLRMRQLSSGYIAMRDNDERIEVGFDPNPKFDRLIELLAELPQDRQAVVFYEYTRSGRQIVEAVKDMGLRPIWMWSGTKNANADREAFIGGRADVAVVNNKLGAMSLDGFQVANYLFFYESPVSPIDRDQAECRVRRQGQLHHIFQYDLVCEGTADVHILGFHQEGRDLYEELRKNPGLLTRKT